MKVLFVTNMYPIPERPFFGIFVKEQIDGLKYYFPNVENEIFFIKGYKNIINYILSIFQINRKLIFSNYDVVHIHFGLSGIFLLFCFHRKNKVIVTLHGSDINIESSSIIKVWLTQRVIKLADHVVCVSERMSKKLKRINNISVLPCAVNTNLFLPSNIPKDNDSILTIVFPSSKNRQVKNYQLFEAILSILRKKYNLLINEVVIDNMTREEVAITLKSADILILTSISEGSPQIVKEAMSCNIPVVSTNVGDVEVLLNGVSNSYIVNSYSPEDFIDPILKIIKKSGEKRFSNGRERISKLKLDTREVSQAIMNIYLT